MTGPVAAPTDELFRPTSHQQTPGPEAVEAAEAAEAADSTPTGRERHDAKITVYVSGEELLDLERAKLTLRGEHRVAVDRGRIVREAIAVVLADLEERGADSVLVRRLRGI
jgi:hypothetical protein